MEESTCYIEAEAQAGTANSRGLLRVRGLTVAMCCGTVIAMAAWLTPESAGIGTHRQMGLQACSFYVRTGYPCPTCGFTTSVSAMANGRFALSLASHPFGVVFFTGLVVLFSAALREVITGRKTLSRLGKPSWWVWAFIIGIPTGWALKLIWGIANGTLPA